MLNILPSTRQFMKNGHPHDGSLEQFPKKVSHFSDKNYGKNKKTEEKGHSVDKHAALKQLLRRYGLRPTRQRMVIAACLFRGKTHHVSADILHRQIAARGENMSVATIYNSLRHFVDAGLIHTVATCGARQWFCVRKLGTTLSAEEIDINQGCHCQFYFDDNQHIEALEHEGFDSRLLPSAPEGYEIARIDVAIHLTKKTRQASPHSGSS